MIKTKKQILLVFIVLLQFCNSNKQNSKFDLLNSMKTEGYKYVLVLPDAGCLSCIDATEIFVKENKDNFKDFGLVFSGTISPKSISNRLGSDILTKPYVYFDSINSFRIDYEMTIYPQIIYLEGDRIIFKEVSPYQTGSLDSLKLVMGF
ncbi:hypothetical protein MM213_09675 [Belliella sp. R4-6]|uniref:Alkyl hydroperoxide reductase subunit C/ Thiol specific antioxidant domain-containing protein n=1 Tax=Belliella alkalica TaxID=1730871 RepID=A0ABS9VCZ9_9BACT|nr:hypothetical protein [Belliella alkalica]MCH7413753.1 hypothetical protein [Belliella alkalica]